MINVKIFKTYPIIKLFNTELSKTYINLYVDGKFNPEFNFSYFKQIHLNKILNSKSISVKYVKRRKFQDRFTVKYVIILI